MERKTRHHMPILPRLSSVVFLLCLVAPWPAWAEPVPEAGLVDRLAYRKCLASADTRFAATWIAEAYQVPNRVAEELLFNGYSYAETLIAMAFMGEGLSLNEVLEQRRLRGGARWQEIGKVLDLDTTGLPAPISELLWFGRNQEKPPVLHFLPDPHPGIARDLVIPAFEPTVPDQVAQRRFRLNKKEVANIRTVLDNPLGVPEADLLLPAGRGLYTADWVMAGTVAYFKPYPMETLLAARVGEEIPWSEVAMAFGLRPDVLTQGPLSGIYPVLAGHAPNTVLIARKREKYPETLPLEYDLERMTPGEKRALEPLMHLYYNTTQEEKLLLTDRGLEIAEQGIALSLARMSNLSLGIILVDYSELGNWNSIVTKYAIDLSGRPELEGAINIRTRT